jgi:hypothetical protein
VPVEPATSAGQLAFIIDHCRAVAVVTQARLASVVATATAKSATVRLVVLSGADWAPCAQSCLRFEEVVNRHGPQTPLAVVGGDDDPVVRFYAPLALGMTEPVVMTHAQVADAAVRMASTPPRGNTAVLKAPAIASARTLYRLLAAIAAGVTLTLERGATPPGEDGEPAGGYHGDDRGDDRSVAWDGRRPASGGLLGEAKRPWRD